MQAGLDPCGQFSTNELVKFVIRQPNEHRKAKINRENSLVYHKVTKCSVLTCRRLHNQLNQQICI